MPGQRRARICSPRIGAAHRHTEARAKICRAHTLSTWGCDDCVNTHPSPRRPTPPGHRCIRRIFGSILQLRAAARERHFGRLLRAYRLVQTPPVQQTQLAGWLGITQGQLSRLERALTPVRDLVKLDHWSRVLHIPTHLLWFELSPDPSETPTAPPPRATVEEPDRDEDDEPCADEIS